MREPRQSTFPIATAVVAALLAFSPPGQAAEPAIDFDRAVRPIFATRCFSCHGAAEQESDFRLDRRESALAGGAGGVAIIAGKSGESPLVDRISSADPDVRMPPTGEPLSTDEVAVLRAWIDQGAHWPAESSDGSSVHWSLRPLAQPPPVPTVDAAGVVRNQIDAFILAKLAAQGLPPAPEADRRTLIRRLSFDLTGLPPTADDAKAFIADSSPDAYERLVERLLASPRYGERWARHWLDVVHFAETHGNDQDRPRANAWPYRDYLIRSFNDDKPYARFVSEQIAGDALFADDPQAIVAMGFLSAGPWDESSLMCIVDDSTDKKFAQVLDRDDMIYNTMSTFASTTVHCARCHDHKFDPVSQAEYYGLQAVFAGVDRAERPFDPDPAVYLRRRALADELKRVAAAAGDTLLADAPLQSAVATAEADLRAGAGTWSVVVPSATTVAKGSTTATQSDGSVLFSGPVPDTETYTFTIPCELTPLSAIRLELLPDASLPQQGPGQAENGNLHLSEFKLLAAPAPGAAAAPVKLAAAYADFDQEGWPVAAAIDGKAETAWGIFPQIGRPHEAVFILAEPLTSHAPLTVVLEQQHGRGHVIGRLRLSLAAAADPHSLKPLPQSLAGILNIPAEQRNKDQQIELSRAVALRRVERELASLPAPQMVYAAAHEFKGGNNFRPSAKPRPVHVLRRGDINQPLAEAQPGALACVAGIEPVFQLEHPDDEGSRRAALARWLTARDNVLVWRSIVNRVWHYHFDRGIVDTPNDLGVMGGQPSHPELLDWLAVWFRDNGGSLKALHRLIVTSAVYRQSSLIDPEHAAVDAENRLLWRANGRRLDAECIRDAVLQTSGKLDLAMGGPSVKQFVETPGIHVTPNVDYHSYDIDSPGNYRRSIYRFLFRTLPDPLMESLDCPDGSQLAPSRAASVTAIQALALLDNRFIVRQSEHTANRLAGVTADPVEQIRLLFQWVLLRDPGEDESLRWRAYAEQHGLPNACRMMFNTNEFVFVN